MGQSNTQSNRPNGLCPAVALSLCPEAKMAKGNLIALAGFARCGKSVFGQALVERAGFTDLAFGSVIKAFFGDFIAGDSSISELQDAMLAVNPQMSTEEWLDFYDRILIPFWKLDLMCDAHTEDDADKSAIRPILERGGELIYDYVFTEYFAQVDALLADGKPVVNTRLVKIPEARAWRERGGQIILVQRKDWPPSTEWEHDALEALIKTDLTTGVTYNHGTAEEWALKANEYADKELA